MPSVSRALYETSKEGAKAAKVGTSKLCETRVIRRYEKKKINGRRNNVFASLWSHSTFSFLFLRLGCTSQDIKPSIYLRNIKKYERERFAENVRYGVCHCLDPEDYACRMRCSWVLSCLYNEARRQIGFPVGLPAKLSKRRKLPLVAVRTSYELKIASVVKRHARVWKLLLLTAGTKWNGYFSYICLA